MVLTRKGEKVDIKYNFGVYLSFLKKYKFLAGLVMFFTMFLTLRKIIEKYLFKIIIDKGTEYVEGAIVISEFVDTLVIIAIVFFMLIIFVFISIWFREHFTIKVTTRMMQDIKRKYFDHIVGLHHDFHQTHKTGSMISRLLRGGHAVDRLNDTMIYQFAPLIVYIIAVMGTFAYFDWISALIVFVVAVVFVSYGMFLQRLQQTANLEAIKIEDIEKANVSDFLTNIDSVTYFGKEKRNSKRISDCW